MKKLALPLLLVSMMFAAPALADGPSAALPAPGADAIPLGAEHDALCREARTLQENRIRDLRAAIEYDKKLEHELIEGARVRDADAAIKEAHAKRWREASGRVADATKKNAFNSFATWLESEARVDRSFASERRNAAGIIGKGWNQAASAIQGHERFLADLKTHC